jgi:hypothetical protein
VGVMLSIILYTNCYLLSFSISMVGVLPNDLVLIISWLTLHNSLKWLLSLLRLKWLVAVSIMAIY